MTIRTGDTTGRIVSRYINEPVADETALAALPSTSFAHLASIRVGSVWWYYDANSAAAAVAGSVVVPVDAPAAGRFLVGGSGTLQSFDATLVAGTATKSTGIVVRAATRVVGIVPTVRGGTFPAGGFQSLTAGNVIGGAGTGAVTITARKADGTLENGCTDTVSVLLVG